MSVRAAGYEPMNPIRRDVAERWLASGDTAKILRALLRLSMHGPDFAYAERRALEFALHDDVCVRRNVATALAHIALFHGSIDVDAVMAALVKLLDDPDVFGWADEALDRVEHQMKTDRRRYTKQRTAAAV